MLQTAKRILHIVTRGSRKIVLHPGESLLIVRMAAWVAILSFLVKRRPLPRALEMISSRRQAAGGADPEKLARAIDLLLGLDLLVFKPICWKRAAILHRYLGLNGIQTQVVFGVRKQAEGVLDGHAWLEANGEPILEAKLPDYRVTYTFPSKHPANPKLDLARYDECASALKK